MYDYVSLARIDLVHIDEDGTWCDITTLPEQNSNLTAKVGTPYAGDGFGLWLPLKVDDLVVVGVPNGNPNTNLTVIARIWNGLAKPPQLVQDNPDDVALVVEKSRQLRILTEEADATLQTKTSGKVEIDSAGDINLKLSGNGHGHLGSDTATEPLLLGQKTETAFQTWTAAFNAGALALPAAATDPATTLALVNAIRVFLLSFATPGTGINAKLVSDITAALSQKFFTE